MKAKALIGFTFVDAMVWLACECREKGVAMAVSGDHRRAWLGPELFLIEGSEERAREAAAKINLDLGEIITRDGELAA